MKKKITTIAIFCLVISISSCGGNQAPKEGNDTVSKADVTKDTLNIDTNKSAGKDSIGIKADTAKMKK